ncbi:DUF4198 domain-containing protein [uncultured Sulfitobacter sp.]|uniref:DUF4198 domain-containing protein n=1 Tax=uncultured Sulfitobacter sp. TaxID=191468 RepID=UPI00261229E3|nr:DUF4198 domain-containing protein [uncultured Sulfitobacter sp.]
MKLNFQFIILFATLALAPRASAHEFWIEPTEFQVQKDKPVVADLKNGQLFKGTRQSFFADRNTYFNAMIGDRTIAVTGRMGDRPAIQLDAPDMDGLMIIAHEAAPSSLSYNEWAKFMKFVAHKDFKQAVTIHEARGWPKEGFRETYTRHSKSLVAVGSGEGSDRALGLATEFVALDNPYSPELNGTLDVALFYQGAPRADAQIEIYERDSEKTVEVTIQRTDAQGRATITVKPGFDYMVDAVVLRPTSDGPIPEGDPVWETLWASLTFSVPAP